MAKYKSFIIHLKRSERRKAQVDDLISKSPFDAEVVDAVDGRLLSDQDINECYKEQLFLRPKYPFGMNSGEIGCFLSHRAAWQRIVDQNLTAGLVFEDDVQIDPDVFSKNIQAAQAWSKEYGFIQFQVRGVPEKCKVLDTCGNVQLLQPSPTLLRCSAQLISRAAAIHLLKETEKFDRPVDGVLQMHWVTGLRPVCVEPSGVSDRTRETGGSTLSIKTPKLTKLVREWQRMVYRRKVVRYSKKSFKPMVFGD
ncbi:glycosyltransferase family 25 protein [Amylibacter sp. SFDW26]|uniref:glycosyltransferase family 25 protein n=1 Tax=Amylibacter sp. SFDW26 TaxID=2652722 RepID=UPI0018698EC8|nr:glycosyltransferase family 25 protein [Amylibacter sp. SFDW26]